MLRTKSLLLLWLVFCLLSSGAVRAHDILCRRCGATITSVSRLVGEAETPPASAAGEDVKVSEQEECLSNLNRFKNRVGQSFDLALFDRAVVKTAPAKSIQDSFFPGYSWRIAECPVCGAFLGWNFERPEECHNDEPASEVSNPKPAVEELRESKEEETVDAEKVLDVALKGKCLTKLLGYWSVEWCYKQHVMQFHVPGPSTRRDPQYSLGDYAGQEEILLERPRIEQRFVKGQRCDETNGPRSSTVLLVCCSQLHSGAATHHVAPFIASYREPALCSYELVICIPELCRVPRYLPRGPSSNDPITGHIIQTASSSSATQAANNVNALPSAVVCASGSPPKSAKRWFYGFDWSALVCEAGSGLEWTKSLQPMVGTGQFT